MSETVAPVWQAQPQLPAMGATDHVGAALAGTPGEKIEALLAQVRVSVLDADSAARGYIAREPLKAAAVSAALGALLTTVLLAVSRRMLRG